MVQDQEEGVAGQYYIVGLSKFFKSKVPNFLGEFGQKENVYQFYNSPTIFYHATRALKLGTLTLKSRIITNLDL